MNGSIWSRLALAGALAAMGPLAAPGVGAAAEPDADPALGQCIAARADALDFSGSASVDAPGARVSYVRGLQSGPASRPITSQDRFNLASAGKMFTAVAVAQLIEAGKLGLDDPVGRHVDGLTPEAGAVTVRQLLTHSSGLGNFFTSDNLETVSRARTVAELMPLVRAEKPAFAPGSRFEYSNSGFLILGRLVERVSGESYGGYLQRKVFAPAGMTSSGIEPGAPASRAVGMTAMPPMSPGAGPRQRLPGPGPGQGSGARPAGPLRPAMEAALRGNPAGGSYSTPQDMHRFFAALSAGRLVSAAMVQKMTSAQIVALPAQGALPELDYGLGFGVGVSEGHRWFGHNGGAPGATVEATAYPDDQASVVVMSNRDPPGASLLFRQMRGVMFHRDRLRACAAGR